MIVVLGPTACGKTHYATRLAAEIDGEIISADSRQVFRGMDIGTGKDLNEYTVNGKSIPYHLIDIRNSGEEYSVFDFVSDFHTAYNNIVLQKKTPILCGGTGLYLSAILQHYEFSKVPIDKAFHEEMNNIEHVDLIARLQSIKTTHNTTDFETKERTIRALEIALYDKKHASIGSTISTFPKISSEKIFAIFPPRDIVRQRITQRLRTRLNTGLIEEVETLIKNGVPTERLLSYGLEYKFVTLYLLGNINKTELFEQLNTAIHQFAKRQMTWFRKMQREGIEMTIIEP
ncbi:MAG: tRNA (adenosine(37)-N6)-dimethylallyltransferase MiaA [Bacteroidales bacterium]|jgi:tRNA dimethylallyltransferase|nr:tRNA (adenosine(37)-N6)-dimethylallyltransferase MiaA [Bacteroidales bacterium]